MVGTSVACIHLSPDWLDDTNGRHPMTLHGFLLFADENATLSHSSCSLGSTPLIHAQAHAAINTSGLAPDRFEFLVDRS